MVNREFRRTKIVATIGPASGSYDMLRLLAEAGMDALRLNFSHGAHAEHAARAALSREVQGLGRPRADRGRQGPRLRVAGVDDPFAGGESSGRRAGRSAGDLVVAAVIADGRTWTTS
jgi:pyruvate kinase